MSKQKANLQERPSDEIQTAAAELIRLVGIVQAKSLTGLDFKTLYRAKDVGAKNMQATTRNAILQGLAKVQSGETRPDEPSIKSEDRMVDVYTHRAKLYGFPAWEDLTVAQQRVWEKQWQAYIARLTAVEEVYMQIASREFALYLQETSKSFI